MGRITKVDNWKTTLEDDQRAGGTDEVNFEFALEGVQQAGG